MALTVSNGSASTGATRLVKSLVGGCMVGAAGWYGAARAGGGRLARTGPSALPGRGWLWTMAVGKPGPDARSRPGAGAGSCSGRAAERVRCWGTRSATGRPQVGWSARSRPRAGRVGKPGPSGRGTAPFSGVSAACPWLPGAPATIRRVPASVPVVALVPVVVLVFMAVSRLGRSWRRVPHRSSPRSAPKCSSPK